MTSAELEWAIAAFCAIVVGVGYGVQFVRFSRALRSELLISEDEFARRFSRPVQLLAIMPVLMTPVISAGLHLASRDAAKFLIGYGAFFVIWLLGLGLSHWLLFRLRRHAGIIPETEIVLDGPSRKSLLTMAGAIAVSLAILFFLNP